jgi:maleylpyruvate isomerase
MAGGALSRGSVSPLGCARTRTVRALAAIIGCDVHPINNRRILETLRHRFGADEAAINEWCGTWIASGFDAFDALISGRGVRGNFSFGGRPTLADAYLVPQIESARRFPVELDRWPRLQAIDAACSSLQAFKKV